MRPRQEGFHGPYRHRRRWRIYHVDSQNRRSAESFETKEEAERFLRRARKLLDEEALTVDVVLTRYERHLRDKGNKSGSIDTTMFRLRAFFDVDESLVRITPERAKKLYDAYRTEPAKRTKRPPSVDTHRNTLAQVKTFMNWCVQNKHLRRNPFDQVEGLGRRSQGKDQLRVSESKRLTSLLLEHCDAGDDAAVAALTAVLLGLRASEIVTRTVRDLDEGGKLLWIPDSKTAAGRRTVIVPEVLRPYLRQQAGRSRTGYLFPTERGKRGHRDRNWVRNSVKRFCRLARVPLVTAHGLRGTHASLAFRAGVSPEVVARSLGHTSARITTTFYVNGEAKAETHQNRVLELVSAGSGKTETAERLPNAKSRPDGRPSA